MIDLRFSWSRVFPPQLSLSGGIFVFCYYFSIKLCLLLIILKKKKNSLMCHSTTILLLLLLLLISKKFPPPSHHHCRNTLDYTSVRRPTCYQRRCRCRFRDNTDLTSFVNRRASSMGSSDSSAVSIGSENQLFMGMALLGKQR